ncbi:MAG TPA: hypothetical protein VFO92_00775 [Nitrososphaeraceae archaeon]|nr:hypothetical protein [Nitrososphaeraceae archaeon]
MSGTESPSEIPALLLSKVDSFVMPSGFGGGQIRGSSELMGLTQTSSRLSSS